MCTGIAPAVSELPVELARKHRLSERVYSRAGLDEFRFLWLQTPTFLPVLWDGKLEILTWGCKVRRSPLTYGGWVTEQEVTEGRWGHPEGAVIQANFVHQKGTWFLITEGIRGLVIQSRGGPVVYMLTKRLELLPEHDRAIADDAAIRQSGHLASGSIHCHRNTHNSPHSAGVTIPNHWPGLLTSRKWRFSICPAPRTTINQSRTELSPENCPRCQG